MSLAIGSRFFKITSLGAFVLLFSNMAYSAGDGGSVSTSATAVFSIEKFPITDSIILSWIVSAMIILIVRYMLRGGVKEIPSTGQAILESAIGGLRSIIEPIVGKRTIKVVFPCLFGYFFFIFLHNVSGLLPGIGSVGIHVNGAFRPFFRPANSDLNTTLALAIVAFFAWAYFCIKCAGVKGLYYEIFGNKADKSEISSIMYSMLFCVFLAVGLIECISIACRVVSLSFRLFGNTFGGENLLHNMCGFSKILKNVPVANYLSYLIPLPFYFLEFLVAMIQAFVFTLLVSVYIGLVCNHGDHEHEEKFLGKGQIC